MGERKWGKAGERLDPHEAERTRKAILKQRNEYRQMRERQEAEARQLWAHGEVKPFLITARLNVRELYGPEVDAACGVAEPTVDLWEAGKVYPTWDQMLALSELCGTTPLAFCQGHNPIALSATSMRFHEQLEEEPPPVWSFPVNVWYPVVCA